MGHEHEVEATAVKVDGGDEVLLVAEAAGSVLTRWILALMDSLVALVMRCARFHLPDPVQAWSMRMAARCCLTLGLASSRNASSIYAATWMGFTMARSCSLRFRT